MFPLKWNKKISSGGADEGFMRRYYDEKILQMIRSVICNVQQ